MKYYLRCLGTSGFMRGKEKVEESCKEEAEVRAAKAKSV